jgi:hypothetical protein
MNHFSGLTIPVCETVVALEFFRKNSNYILFEFVADISCLSIMQRYQFLQMNNS